MIVLFHAHSISKRILFPDGSVINDAPVWWYSTVDLFFVMSGFLMVHMSRKLFGSFSSIKIFLAKRAARTPPLYWIYTILTAIILITIGGTSVSGDHVTWERLFASFFFWPIEGGPIIALGWTLNYEVFFYLLFALTIPLTFPRAPLVLCLILCVLTLLGQIFSPEKYSLYFWTNPILLDFVLGLGLGVLYHKGVRLPDYARVILLLLAPFPVLYLDQPFESATMIRPLTFGLSAAMLVAAATLRHKEVSLGKIGSVVATIGGAAYSLYLSHIITLKAIELVYKKLGLAEMWGPIPFIVIGFVGAIVVGYIAYVFFEKPFTAYLRSKIPSS